MEDEPSESTSAAFAQIPRLTHLSFQLSVVPRLNCRVVLDTCPSLNLLVTVWPTQTFLDICRAAFENINDRRFVMLVVRDYEADWAVGARGGADYWARAERIMKIRIAGE
jgi:hypothetical protein